MAQPSAQAFSSRSLDLAQSRTQSPQASWSVDGRREKLWGNGIVTAEILRLTVLSFATVNSQSTANRENRFFALP